MLCVLNLQTWRRGDDHVECDSSVAFRVATGGVAKTSGKKGGGRETDPCALQRKNWWLEVHGKMTESYMKTREEGRSGGDCRRGVVGGSYFKTQDANFAKDW